MGEASTVAMDKLNSLLEMMRKSAEELGNTTEKVAANSIKIGGAFNRQVQSFGFG